MSQGSTILPTTGVFSGLTEQGNINAALAALLSLNSGGSAPASPTQYQFWADTSVSNQVTLRWYIGATWVPLWVGDTNTDAIVDAPLSPKNWVAASGTHDAITATYDPPIVSPIADGTVLSFRATSANLTTAPTFSPNGLSAASITKNGGATLAIGDIPGSLAEVSLRWNLANARFELLNPPAVPVGAIVPYFGGTLPSGYVLPQGQNLPIASFPAAAAVLGTTYGNPGGGNFTVPDMRGRTIAGLDAGGSNRLSGQMSSSTLGATGGQQQVSIAQNQLPNVAPSATFTGTQQNFNVFTSGGNNNTFIANGVGIGTSPFNPGLNSGPGPTTPFAQVTPSGSVSVGSINGNVTQQVLPTLPPIMVINVMMRVL
jgi:microcystin-dependent protein